MAETSLQNLGSQDKFSGISKALKMVPVASMLDSQDYALLES